MTANPLPPIPPISATSGMVPPHGAGRFKPIDPVKVLRQNMVWLIAAGVAGIILGVVTFVVLNMTVPKWTSNAQLRVQMPNLDITKPGGSGMATGGPNAEMMDRFKQTEAFRLRSEEILRQAIDNPMVRDTQWYKQFTNPQKAREALMEDYLSVSPIRGSELIVVSVSTKAEDDARRLLQSVLDVYLREIERDASGGVAQQQRALEQARAQVEDEMKRLESQRSNFLTTYDLTSLNTQQSAASFDYQNLAKQNADLRFGLDATRELVSILQQKMDAGDMTPTPEAMTQIEMSPDILMIQNRINGFEEDVKTNAARYGENHPVTLEFKERLASAQTQKKQELDRKVREYQVNQVTQARNSVASLEGQIQALQTPLKEAQARMSDLQARIAQYESIMQQLDSARINRDRYNQALTDLNAVRQRPDYIAVRLYASPTEPEKTFPKIAIIVPGVTLLVLGAVAGLIFLRELLDQRMKSPADVKLLPEADLLGVIPSANEDPSGPTGVERVVEKYPSGLLAESFRETRTAILNKMDRRGYRTLMVVGGQPQAGVSTVAHNLATSLAYNGRNVLIIDVNFRRPAQHRLVGISNDIGVVDVINGRATVQDAIIQLDGLSVSVLPTGGAADEAPECLECPAFRSLLGQVEAAYDIVIIDAPPALLASESQLLAKHVDALAIVVRAMSDKRGMVERMFRRLDGHRADILGVILNGVRSSAGGYFRKNYRDFYRYRDAAVADRGATREPVAVGAGAPGGNGTNGHHANGNGTGHH